MNEPRNKDKYQVFMLFAIQGIEQHAATAPVVFRGVEIQVSIAPRSSFPSTAFKIKDAEIVSISTGLVFFTREESLDFVEYFSNKMVCLLVNEGNYIPLPAAQLIHIEISWNGTPAPPVDLRFCDPSPGPTRLTEHIKRFRAVDIEADAIWEASYFYNRHFFAAHWSVRITDLVNALEAFAPRTSRSNEELTVVNQLESVVLGSDLGAEAKNKLRNAVCSLRKESVRQCVVQMVLASGIQLLSSEDETKKLLHLAYDKRSDFSHGKMRHMADAEDYSLIRQLQRIVSALIIRRRGLLLLCDRDNPH